MTEVSGGEGPVILVAPTERGAHVTELMSRLQVVRNLLPEGKGCDMLWASNGLWYGVQRKELKDLWASLDDGRLAKEMAQAKHLGTVPWLVVEGKLDMVGDGVMIGRRSVTMETFHKLLLSVGEQGWNVQRTSSAKETGVLVAAMHSHTRKQGKHKTGTSRPKATGVWGEASSKEWAAHLLQGFEGVGPDTARAIVEALGLPLAWTVGEKELMQVPGVGKKRAAQMIRALEKGQK